MAYRLFWKETFMQGVVLKFLIAMSHKNCFKTQMNPRLNRRMRTFAFLLLFVQLTFGSSCTRKSQLNTGESATKNTIVIGEVDSMTGNEATFGIDTYRGVALAIQEINEKGGIRGKTIELVTSDVQGRPDEGARAISKLVTQNKAVAIITGATSSNAMAMAPIAQQSQVPLVATAATNPKLTQLGDFIFRVCFIDPFQGEVMAKFASEHLHLNKVAILRDIRSDYSIGLADIFTSVFKSAAQRENSKEIQKEIIDQSYSGGDIDFRSQLTAIRSRKPEAIFVPGYYTDVSLIARQARELGITVPLLGGDGWDSPKLKEIGGGSLSGSFFSNFYTPDDPKPAVLEFSAKFKKLYGVAPDGSAAMGYESARLLIDALQRAKSFSPHDIRAALAATQNFDTLNGKMSIDQNRNAAKSAVVLKIDRDGTPKYWVTINPDSRNK